MQSLPHLRPHDLETMPREPESIPGLPATPRFPDDDGRACAPSTADTTGLRIKRYQLSFVKSQKIVAFQVLVHRAWRTFISSGKHKCRMQRILRCRALNACQS